jgi:hypothetical protein
VHRARLVVRARRVDLLLGLRSDCLARKGLGVYV